MNTQEIDYTRPRHRVDLHVHSSASDGLGLPEEVARKEIENGLAIVVLTDHDTFDGVKRLIDLGFKNILVGIEKTTAQGHLMALFPHGIPDNESTKYGYSLRDTVRMERNRGKDTMIISVHPGYGPGFSSQSNYAIFDLYNQGEHLDGIETAEPYFTKQQFVNARNLVKNLRAQGIRIMEFGASDSHTINPGTEWVTLYPNVTGDPIKDLVLVTKNPNGITDSRFTTEVVRSDLQPSHVALRDQILYYPKGLVWDLRRKVTRIPTIGAIFVTEEVLKPLDKKLRA